MWTVIREETRRINILAVTYPTKRWRANVLTCREILPTQVPPLVVYPNKENPEEGTWSAYCDGFQRAWESTFFQSKTFTLRWFCARDLFGPQIPVTAGGFEL